MRPIVKPDAPNLDYTSFFTVARALGNAVGRCCSFCEKALTQQLRLFHKHEGLLTVDAPLTRDDWTSLLLICGECAASIKTFNSNEEYFWPDKADSQVLPYLYLPQAVTVTVRSADGEAVFFQGTVTFVLVTIDTEVPKRLQAAAQRTYDLFRLNGRFFDEEALPPSVVLPYSEFIRETDTRLHQRTDVYLRARRRAEAFARGIPLIPLGSGYVQEQLAMLTLAIQGLGYYSTWMTTITQRLDAIDEDLVPELDKLLNPDANPTRDRKRRLAELEQNIEKAKEKVPRKRSRINQTLLTALKTKG